MGSKKEAHGYSWVPFGAEDATNIQLDLKAPLILINFGTYSERNVGTEADLMTILEDFFPSLDKML